MRQTERRLAVGFGWPQEDKPPPATGIFVQADCKSALRGGGPRRAIDVLGLGAVAVDDLPLCGRLSAARFQGARSAPRAHCGGLAATALVAAARLGARCAYAGVLSNDELSAFALACLEREGIDVSRAPRQSSAGPVHSYIMVDQRRGTRNIFSYEPRVVGASVRTPRGVDCLLPGAARGPPRRAGDDPRRAPGPAGGHPGRGRHRKRIGTRESTNSWPWPIT